MQERVDLIVTQTNNSVDSEGGIAGFQGTSFIPVIISFFVSIALFITSMFMPQFEETNIALKLIVSLTPTYLTVLIIKLLFNDKPPGYASDKISMWINGKDFNVDPYVEEKPYPIVSLRDKD